MVLSETWHHTLCNINTPFIFKWVNFICHRPSRVQHGYIIVSVLHSLSLLFCHYGFNSDGNGFKSVCGSAWVYTISLFWKQSVWHIECLHIECVCKMRMEAASQQTMPDSTLQRQERGLPWVLWVLQCMLSYYHELLIRQSHTHIFSWELISDWLQQFTVTGCELSLFLTEWNALHGDLCSWGFGKDNSSGIIIPSCTICTFRKGFALASFDEWYLFVRG